MRRELYTTKKDEANPNSVWLFILKHGDEAGGGKWLQRYRACPSVTAANSVPTSAGGPGLCCDIHLIEVNYTLNMLGGSCCLLSLTTIITKVTRHDNKLDDAASLVSQRIPVDHGCF